MSRAAERCSCVLFCFTHRPRLSSVPHVGYFTSYSGHRSYLRVYAGDRDCQSCSGNDGHHLQRKPLPAAIPLLLQVIEGLACIGPPHPRFHSAFHDLSALVTPTNSTIFTET